MRKTKYILTLALMLTMLIANAQRGARGRAADKLGTAEYIIENWYVDEVNSDSIVEEAIKAMLKTLDPHSAYTNVEETEELTQPLEGKFSGIGVQFNMSTDTVYVIQTIPGGPSEKVGIRPGDRIIFADDTLLAGRKLPNSKILKTLRGPKGTKVNLKIKRGNEPELIDFVVIRDDIPINSVDAVYMVTPEIGYISLTRFAEDSGREVAEAIQKLEAQGMKKLILDLDDNGGGYLGAAVELASLFLNHDDLIVFTQGRSQPYTEYRVESRRPMFTGDLVVMVNQYSASASEILSGALQDHDRATIVGRRTFGKGLVQRPFELQDGSMIRLTVSKYYTPSGRSIQKHYEKGKGEEYARDMIDRYESGELWSVDSVHLDTTKEYYTKKGRIVYGGGGIMPDVFVPLDTAYNSRYYRDIVAKNVLNTFLLSYIDNHRQEMLAQYPNEEVYYQNFGVGPDLIEAMIAKAEDEGVPRNDEDIATSMPMLQAVIKGLLARDLYENGVYMRAVNPLNPIFVKALKILEDEK